MKFRKKRVWTDADIRLNEESTTLTAQIHGLSCPVCGSRNYVKRGKEKGNQRYLCTKCGKHFRSTTGCTIHHLHLKPKIQQYLECMDQGLSLRKTAVKCDMSLQTAFRWRHRFLNAMHHQVEPRLHENKTLSAIVLPYSNKGKPKPEIQYTNITSILQVDVAGKANIHVLGKYGLSPNRLTNITTGRTAYIASNSIPKMLKQELAKCITDEQVQKTQIVTEHIYSWLAKFRGVASKYLENYWRWITHIRQTQEQLSPHALYMHNCF